MHHGAGSSGLSFALVASEIRKVLPAAGVLSFDSRGHGETTTSNDQDLSLATLSQDFVNMINLVKEARGWSKIPDLVLVGHSLGGAVVVDAAKGGLLGDSVLGYAVLDVVEGSAMDALQSMQTYLSTRPMSFTSLSQGIEWQYVARLDPHHQISNLVITASGHAQSGTPPRRAYLSQRYSRIPGTRACLGHGIGEQTWQRPNRFGKAGSLV